MYRQQKLRVTEYFNHILSTFVPLCILPNLARHACY